MKDLLIPIVFPEYQITVNTPRAEVDVLPWFDFDNVVIPASENRYSNLGHAGILLVNGRSGLTKYYEYGRYDAAELGIVRRVPVPDARIENGSVNFRSLVSVMRRICNVAGKGSRAEGVFLESEGVFDNLVERIQLQKSQNNNPNRKPYNVVSNSCIHFVKRIVERAELDAPWMIDPRPNSYIGEFRDEHLDLDYLPKEGLLRIESHGEFFA